MSGKQNYKRVFQVTEDHEAQTRHQMERFTTRPALFPNGTPGVTLASNGNILAVLPEADAQLLAHHIFASLARARGKVND